MRARTIVLPCLVAGFFVLAGPAQAKTIVTSPQAKKLLLGRHLFSLKWLKWKRFGIASVHEKDGTLFVSIQQHGFVGEGKKDYIRMQGRIERLDGRSFVFHGLIATRVHYLNHGRPCVRRGRMVWRIIGRRPAWRFRPGPGPCTKAADYVDILFLRPRKLR